MPKFSRFFFIVCTISNATPAVVTSAAHELYVDDIIWFETTGSLPTGLTADTDYYVINNGITADTFQVSASEGGTAINTSSEGSGTHKFQKQNRARLYPLQQENR
jgi:hypothetical protein|tara:strand:- start:3123 stop:3437 length:315 start_codon:yes stop_codon:yes gene_type:complete